MRYAALLSASKPRDLYHSPIPAFLLVFQRPPEILLSTTGRRREPSYCNAGSRGGVQLVDARQQFSLPWWSLYGPAWWNCPWQRSDSGPWRHPASWCRNPEWCGRRSSWSHSQQRSDPGTHVFRNRIPCSPSSPRWTGTTPCWHSW